MFRPRVRHFDHALLIVGCIPEAPIFSWPEQEINKGMIDLANLFQEGGKAFLEKLHLPTIASNIGNVGSDNVKGLSECFQKYRFLEGSIFLLRIEKTVELVRFARLFEKELRYFLLRVN
jgi:hypothetical protein